MNDIARRASARAAWELSGGLRKVRAPLKGAYEGLDRGWGLQLPRKKQVQLYQQITKKVLARPLAQKGDQDWRWHSGEHCLNMPANGLHVAHCPRAPGVCTKYASACVCICVYLSIYIYICNMIPTLGPKVEARH